MRNLKDVLNETHGLELILKDALSEMYGLEAGQAPPRNGTPLPGRSRAIYIKIHKETHCNSEQGSETYENL